MEKAKQKIITYYKPKLKPDSNQIEEFVDLLVKSQNPIFYVGGGVINSGDVASKIF